MIIYTKNFPKEALGPASCSLVVSILTIQLLLIILENTKVFTNIATCSSKYLKTFFWRQLQGQTHS